jgi:Tol biopolymer transport system component
MQTDSQLQTRRLVRAEMSRRQAIAAFGAASFGLAAGCRGIAHASAMAQAESTAAFVFQDRTKDGSRNNGIFLADPDGYNVVQIAGDASYSATHPDWSPDGLQIIYTNESEGTLWTIGVDGADRRKLVDVPDASHYCDYAAWSPDGSRIAYTRYTLEGDGPPPASVIVVQDFDSGSITEVVKMARPNLVDVPRWSGDGDTIIIGVDMFDADFNEDGAAIGSVPAAGGEVTYLTKFDHFGYQPDWNRVSNKIVFSTEVRQFSLDPADRGDLYTMNADGTELAKLTQAEAGTYLEQPTWTPDGERILATMTDPVGRVAVWVDPATGEYQIVQGYNVHSYARLRPGIDA